MPTSSCHAVSDKPATEAEKKQGEDKAMGGAVKSQAEKAISQQRKKIIDEAVSALPETKNALRALDEKKTEEALAALERASGKLDIVLARDPKLALAPIDIDVTTYAVYATLDAIKKAKEQAENYLEDGEVQKARVLKCVCSAHRDRKFVPNPAPQQLQAVRRCQTDYYAAALITALICVSFPNFPFEQGQPPTAATSAGHAT
jgi:hypothetical protein